MKDLNLERNVLMKYIYPKLKVYCREKYGFDFYVSLFMSCKCIFDK